MLEFWKSRLTEKVSLHKGLKKVRSLAFWVPGEPNSKGQGWGKGGVCEGVFKEY